MDKLFSKNDPAMLFTKTNGQASSEKPEITPERDTYRKQTASK